MSTSATRANSVQITSLVSCTVPSGAGGLWWDGNTTGPKWRKADGTDVTLGAGGGGSTGNWTFSLNNSDLSGAGTMGVGTGGTATGVQVGTATTTQTLGAIGSSGAGWSQTWNPFYMEALTSSGGATLKNSAIFNFQPRYWNGAADTTYNIGLTGIMDSTGPTAHLSIQFAGVEKFAFANTGNITTASGSFDISAAGALALGGTNATSAVIGGTGTTGRTLTVDSTGAYITFGGGGVYHQWTASAYSPINNVIALGASGNCFTQAWVYSYMTKSQAITATATTTITPSSGSFVKLNLQSATNVTSLTVSAGNDGQELVVQIIQPGAGTAATVPTTWTNVSFAGGSFTNTATLGKRDEITLMYDGTTSKWYEIGRALNLTN